MSANAIQRLRDLYAKEAQEVEDDINTVDALYHATKHMHDTLRNLPNDEITIGVVFDLLAPVAAAVRQAEGQ